MKVFLTGGAGFIGIHTTLKLIKAGHDVCLLMRPGCRLDGLSEIKHGLHVMTGCLEDIETLRTEILAFSPDAVIHLAWKGVDPGDRNEDFQRENMDLTRDLMDLAAEGGSIKHWISLGSQAEYGPCNVAISETTSAHPTTTYGKVKLETGLVSQELAKTYGIRFAWLRLFSCYGPFDYGNSFIPFLIKSLLENSSPGLTLGEQQWDYLYVEDVAEAIVSTLEQSEVSGIFNLGSGRPVTIRTVAEAIRDHIDPGLTLKFGAYDYRPDQVMHMTANVEKLQAATGWRPRVGWNEGMEKTVRWYRETSF